MTTDPAPLTLTVHELRALARLEGLVLPAFVTDADDDDPVVDLVALRGLVARDLVVLDTRPTEAGETPSVVLAPGLAALVAPTRAADALVVEVDDERPGTEPLGWAVVGAPDGPGCTFAERPGAVVTLTRTVAAPLADVPAHAGVDDVAADPGAAGFVVALGLQVAADAAVLDGDRDEAVAVLVDGGVPSEAAARWVEAVASRRRSVAVQVAARERVDGPVRAAELRWLMAGDGTAWRLTPRAEPIVDPEAAGLDLDEQDRASLVTVVVEPIGRADLHAALAALDPTPATITPGSPR